MRKLLGALAAGASAAIIAGALAPEARAEAAEVTHNARCTTFVPQAGGFFIASDAIRVEQPHGGVVFVCRFMDVPGVVAPERALVLETTCSFEGRTSPGQVVVTPAGDIIVVCVIPA